MKEENSITSLYNDICQLIEQARTTLAQTANRTLTIMYWQIGERINNELLRGERAAYGKQIVSQVATLLQEQFGKRGFQERNIRRMMQFAELFPDFQIVSQAATKLSWSHFVEIISLKEELQREFYLGLAINENWSRNTLRSKIDSMLFERIMISEKPDELIKKEEKLNDNKKYNIYQISRI